MLTNSEKSAQHTVLVVDDTPENIDVLFSYLHNADLRILIAQSGEEAIRTTERFLPDLILLDVLMPGLNGFETCRRLKSNPRAKDIPVIFITALSDLHDIMNGFEAGGVDYLTKPLRYEEVLARVHTHLLLRRQQRQLQELNAAKDTFFSIIAHDLRGPMHSLNELTQAGKELIDLNNIDKLKQLIALQATATENLCKLLENLLTWARIQQGSIEFEPQNVRFGQLCQYVISLFSAIAQQKSITLRAEIAEGVSLRADMNMLETMLRNLIGNALKFTHQGGTVTVALINRAEDIELTVTDSGIGIEADMLPKLFEIGAKYRRNGTANEHGTGLGLILCKEFAAWHGGKIWAESVVNQGSTFHVTLPKPREAAAS